MRIPRPQDFRGGMMPRRGGPPWPPLRAGFEQHLREFLLECIVNSEGVPIGRLGTRD